MKKYDEKSKEMVNQLILEMEDFVAKGCKDDSKMFKALENTGWAPNSYPDEIKDELEFFWMFYFGPPPICSGVKWDRHTEHHLKVLKSLIMGYVNRVSDSQLIQWGVSEFNYNEFESFMWVGEMSAEDREQHENEITGKMQ